MQWVAFGDRYSEAAMMNIRYWKRLGAVLAAALVPLAAFGIWQLRVPDIEKAQQTLFSGFDDLDRLGAYVIGHDGKSLGKISRSSGTDSLGNTYGAGSTYKTDGLFNEHSKYGSRYGMYSAFSKSASEPPEILIRQGNKTYSVGLLTKNKLVRTDGQRIDPDLLMAWLKQD